MHRRQFATLLCATAVGVNLRAIAQEQSRPTVGFMMGRSEESSRELIKFFIRGLSEAGFQEGRNVSILYRYADGDYGKLPAIAEEFASRKVNVIAAGWPSGNAAKTATKAIPVVFIGGGDPIRSGLVTNLSHPEANLTGVTMMASDLDTKRLEILRDFTRKGGLIGVVIDANLADAPFQIDSFRKSASALHQPIRIIEIHRMEDFSAENMAAASKDVEAFVVSASAMFNTYKLDIIKSIERSNKPAMYELREFVQSGGLMSYSPSLNDVFRKVGVYVGLILGGKKIEELPVLQPSRFELCFNESTARSTGFEIPPSFLAQVDDFIE